MLDEGAGNIWISGVRLIWIVGQCIGIETQNHIAQWIGELDFFSAVVHAQSGRIANRQNDSSAKSSGWGSAPKITKAFFPERIVPSGNV